MNTNFFYGLDSRAIEIIYKGAVLPTVGYAVPVWVEATLSKIIITKLGLQKLKPNLTQLISSVHNVGSSAGRGCRKKISI